MSGQEEEKEEEEEEEEGVGSCTILKDREHSQNIFCAYIIHRHLQRQVSVDVTRGRVSYPSASM